MSQIKALIEKGVRKVEGIYRLRSPRARTTRDGRPYTAMRIEDMSGQLPAYLWGSKKP